MTRSLLRWGLIGGLGLGAATWLVGPDRVAAAFGQARQAATSWIESAVDDTVALRQQLQDLSEQYPDRIREVTAELKEVEAQIAMLDEDRQRSKLVLAMANEDLGKLKNLVAQAKTEAEATARSVAIRFDGVRFDINEAVSEMRRINNLRPVYRDRLAHDEKQLQFLHEQRTRLNDILTKLTGEYETFQAQLWQLDRQIDTIERNERLIALTEEHQATIDSYERFGKVGNVKQLQAKLAELQAMQEAQFETLTKTNVRLDYEERANMQMNGLDVDDEAFLESIEINPDEVEIEVEDHRDHRDDRVALREPVIVE